MTASSGFLALFVTQGKFPDIQAQKTTTLQVIWIQIRRFCASLSDEAYLGSVFIHDWVWRYIRVKKVPKTFPIRLCKGEVPSFRYSILTCNKKYCYDISVEVWQCIWNDISMSCCPELMKKYFRYLKGRSQPIKLICLTSLS